MIDKILSAFLEHQRELIDDLCENSSRLKCQHIQLDDALPANLFMVQIQARHLIKVDGAVQESTSPCLIAIRIPADYLRCADASGQVVNLVVPRDMLHPNVASPFICMGHIAAGTPVDELILRCYEIITYNKFTPREDNCLNSDACAWVRQHMEDFPLETGPLRDTRPQNESSPSSGDFVLELSSSNQT